MLWGFLIRLLLGMAFVLSLFQSVRVTVSWWQGELSPGPVEFLWILALPVLVLVYLRYFSVLGCRQCDRPVSADSDSEEEKR